MKITPETSLEFPCSNVVSGTQYERVAHIAIPIDIKSRQNGFSNKRRIKKLEKDVLEVGTTCSKT
jgi:hypothetical protein